MSPSCVLIASGSKLGAAYARNLKRDKTGQNGTTMGFCILNLRGKRDKTGQNGTAF